MRWSMKVCATARASPPTDKTLAAAREQLRAQVGESMLPSIDLGGQATRERAIGVPNFGPPTVLYNLFVGQVRAQYTFDLFGAARLADRALAAQVDSQAWQFDAARRALAANIVTGAIGAAALRAQIDTTERLIVLANEDARDTQRRYELGSASRADALNAQSSAAALAASLPGLARAVARDTSRARRDAWPDAGSGARRISISRRSRCRRTCRWWCRRNCLPAAPTSRPPMRLLKAAAAQVGVATAQMFPSLSLSASMGKAGFSWPARPVRRGRDLGHRRVAVAAAVSWRRTARAKARGAGELRGGRGAVQADGADRVPQRRRFARGARAGQPGAQFRRYRQPHLDERVHGFDGARAARGDSAVGGHARASGSIATRGWMRSAMKARA